MEQRQTVFEIWPDADYPGLHSDIRRELEYEIQKAVDAILDKFTVGTWRQNVNGKWIVEVDKQEILSAINTNSIPAP